MSAPDPRASRAAQSRKAARAQSRKAAGDFPSGVIRLGAFTRPWWRRALDRLARHGWEPVKTWTAKQWRAHVVDTAPDDVTL